MSECVYDHREGWWGGWIQQSFQTVKDKVNKESSTSWKLLVLCVDLAATQHFGFAASLRGKTQYSVNLFRE